MAAHTHDDIDWADRLPGMRLVDDLQRSAYAEVAARLTADLSAGSTILDLGSGSGGMAAALSGELSARGGGTLVLVDAVPELLDAAADAARERGPELTVRAIRADLADPDLASAVPQADLIWASSVVHHLPDQQRALRALVRPLRPRGVFALAEGGLETRCLPWDTGIGTPGLEVRLHAARDEWFREMRAAMTGFVRMPYGWNTALANAGLIDVSAFGFLIDRPAAGPGDLGAAVMRNAVDRLGWFRDALGDRLTADDLETIDRLLDPAGPDHLGNRADVHLLGARTVHLGRAR